MGSVSWFIRQHGKYIGLAFTIAVVGLLLYLHLFARVVVPQPRFQTTRVPDVLICQGAPSYITAELIEEVDIFWRAHGHSLGPAYRAPCGSLARCSWDGKRTVPCYPGAIVIDLRDAAFEEDHGGELLYRASKDGSVAWATILLPSTLRPVEALAPADLEALVLAHEVGHWFGYDHATTPLFWGLAHASPSGHVMSPSVERVGWGDAGLPASR